MALQEIVDDHKILQIFSSKGETVDLSRFNLSTLNCMETVCQSLRKVELNSSKSIYQFDLCNITLDGIRVLCDTLVEIGNIRSISLAWNRLGIEGARIVGEMLQTAVRIHSVNLEGTQLGPHGVRMLSIDISTKNNLDFLNLQENSIGDAGASYIAEHLIKYGIPRRLNLRKNKIGVLGIKSLSEALEVRNSRVTSLDLSFNNITPVGARYISHILETNKSIQSFNLEGTKLEDEGIRRVCWTLKENTTLKSLNLSSNGCSSQGASYIADALSVNDVLNELKLTRASAGEIAIGDSGATCLARMLKVNRGLTKLDLYWCCIGAKGAQAISDALIDNRRLRYLNLGGNYISPQSLLQINNNLKNKTALTWQEKSLWGRAPLEPLRFYHRRRKRIPSNKSSRKNSVVEMYGSKETASYGLKGTYERHRSIIEVINNDINKSMSSPRTHLTSGDMTLVVASTTTAAAPVSTTIASTSASDSWSSRMGLIASLFSKKTPKVYVEASSSDSHPFEGQQLPLNPQVSSSRFQEQSHLPIIATHPRPFGEFASPSPSSSDSELDINIDIFEEEEHHINNNKNNKNKDHNR